MITPNNMPKRPAKMHQTILSALLENKRSSKMTVAGTRRIKKNKVFVDQPITTPVALLPNLVSELNVNRAAERWLR